VGPINIQMLISGRSLGNKYGWQIGACYKMTLVMPTFKAIIFKYNNCFTLQAIQLRDHYYAIEVDSSLTLEQKYPFMVEW